MIAYIIKAVKYDEHEQPVAVIWHQADADANEWIDSEGEAPLARVIAALDRGVPVFLQWFGQGGAVMGPRVQKVVRDDGTITIASAEPERPLSRLPYYEDFENTQDNAADDEDFIE